MTHPSPPPSAGKWAALFLITQFVLMWSAFFILSSAINWPISLDDPASVALPRVLAQSGPMMTGYSCYLLVGLLLVPATAALNERLGLTGGLAGATLALATFSAIAKSIGITRWLFAMPVLAQAYGAPGADQATIAVIFEALNAYAGGIGEILGVGLMSGLWTLIIARALFKSPGAAPKALGVFTAMTGLGLLATIPAGFGVDLGPVLTLSGVIWQFALLGIALWALSKPRAA
jgi:hypothetical protein